ncbi:hypothetical protein [Haloferula sp.]|uniref:hypothetical protein n=1 Tax=Haloferula sp. TaxID=2497595 RepID=UPI003C768E22
MNRRVRILVTLLIICLGFAAWQWLKPYEWNPDPEARAKVVFSRIERDQDFFWLDAYVKITDSRGHDFEKPVRLALADGRELKPADITIEGSAEQEAEAISFRFWLDSKDVVGPLRLRLNDGELLIRGEPIIPDLESREFRFHQSSHW